MLIELINTYDATVSNGPTSVRGSGRDSFTGTLALQSDGTWRGTVAGKADGSLMQRQPGKPVCRSSWLATQQIEVVGQDAPNSATGDFVFIFYPVSDPTGPTGSNSRCPPTKRKHNGVAYAPYNDYNVSLAAEEQGLAIILPPKPGARLNYPFSTADATSNWQVNIEFLDPP